MLLPWTRSGRAGSGVAGKPWTSASVDVLGDLDTAIRIAADKAGLEEGTYRTRLLPRPNTFMEELNEALAAQALQTWQNLRATPAEKALIRQARLLEQLVALHGTVQARMPMEISIR